MHIKKKLLKNFFVQYVLDNGKIVDSGSHEKLLSSCKLYSQLHLKEKLDNAY